MMRVAWNLLWLRPGVVGGSEEYATRHLRALVEHGEVDVTAFVLEPFVDAHRALVRDVRCIVAPLDGADKVRRVAAENTWLATRTRRGFDVVHHVGGRIPTVARGPHVLTVHDLQPLEHPENFSVVKRHFLGRAIPRSVRRAQVVLTPSEHVRRRVLVHFGLDPALVRACPAPVLPAARSGADATGDELPAEVQAVLAAGHPIVLYPAITYTHKNHAVLLEAFARLRRTRPDARLVLTGGAGGADAEVAARCARPDLAGAVVRPGRVPRAALDALLARAGVVAFPSRYEGFGLPVVEALAAGCDVVAARIDALREVVGDDGALVDPDDPDGWAREIERALASPRDAAARAAASARVAARYPAASAAATLTRAYHDAAGW